MGYHQIALTDDLNQDDTSKLDLVTRLVSGQSRQALILGREAPAQWLGIKSSRTTTKDMLEHELK
jgi:hypothetical protein